MAVNRLDRVSVPTPQDVLTERALGRGQRAGRLISRGADIARRVQKGSLVRPIPEAGTIHVTTSTDETASAPVLEPGEDFVCGDCDEETIGTRVAADPKTQRELGAVMTPEEARVWVQADREEGQAPTVRKRQIRKGLRGYVAPVSPLDADLQASVEELVEPTPYVHAERALDQTGRLVRKHGGVVARRPDHATIANDPDEHYRGPIERARRQKYLDAKAPPVIDGIDLAEATLNPDTIREEAVVVEAGEDRTVHTAGRAFSTVGQAFPILESAASLEGLAAAEETREARRDGSRMPISEYGQTKADNLSFE